MKEPWIEAPHIWPTKASFFNFLRGNLRRAVWEKWPLKFEFKNEICKPPPKDYTGKAKSGHYCALSGEWIGKSAAEIDHIKGNVSLQEWEDVLPFVKHLCASKSNMQYVSKEAHKVKSYADKYGISFEKAKIIKAAKAICDAKQDKQWLEERGIQPLSSASKRRDQIIEEMEKEGK